MSWSLAVGIAVGGFFLISVVSGGASWLFRKPRPALAQVLRGRPGRRLLALGLGYLIAATLVMHRYPSGIMGVVVGGGPALIAVLYRFMEVI